MASKTRIPKKVGRPTLEESGFGDYEREMKNTILRFTKPLMEATIKKMAELAGVLKETNTSLEVSLDSSSDTSGKADSGKKEVIVPPTVQLQACKAISELHTNAAKEVYGKGQKEPKEAEDNKPKLSSVSKLSLSVPVQQESKED
jgi:hypothetical protein